MAEVDLERLAAAYDFRLDRGIAERLGPMLAVAGVGPGSTVVDVGGGRGDKASACAATGAAVLLVDPSRAMTAEAVTRGLCGVVARGEALPLGDESADLVFFHLSIHHGDWRAMLDEAWRVVRPGGVVWVWTMSDEHHEASYLTKWFPSVGPIDAGRFPPVADIGDHLSFLGGAPDVLEVEEIVERAAGEWVEAVRAGYVSTLHLVSDDEVQEGLARFAAGHPDPDATIEYRLLFSGVWSRCPG